MVVMQRRPTIRKVFLISVLCLSGCPRTSDNTVARAPAENATNSENPDSVTWIERDLEVEGIKIAVGHRLRLGKPVSWREPVVVITKNGKPVANAMVFCQLVSPDGPSTFGEEEATVFEPASHGDPACYAPGKSMLPEDADSAVIRVRVILPERDQEWSSEFPILLEREPSASQPVL
jgi:hypothetical protein